MFSQKSLEYPQKHITLSRKLKRMPLGKAKRSLFMFLQKLLPMKLKKLLLLNHEILYHLQDVFNLLPNLNVSELVKAFVVKTNDMMSVIYLSSLIRSVIALHNLINNKEHEKTDDSKPVVPTAAGS
ncbi:26S proteasome non-ATPase regulatory subunit 7 A-like [Salvia divinorum]|uniref:26S proteasome non-ATPase regulatory subunit 7 A-like n=1 Tax=Salvia divinorum TaxID=28513 RepID=A0ABD1GLI0_SALDI